MKHVGIADLKARLSEHLRTVRKGEPILVFDRDTAVARIVPIRERSMLAVRKPSADAAPLHRVALPPPAKLRIDVVRLLLDERQSHR